MNRLPRNRIYKENAPHVIKDFGFEMLPGSLGLFMSNKFYCVKL